MTRNFGEQCDLQRNVFLMLIQIYPNELNPVAHSYSLTLSPLFPAHTMLQLSPSSEPLLYVPMFI